MDLQNQYRIKAVAERHSREDIMVILGTMELTGARNFSETVTTGDQSFTGALAGVSLRLPVYHILDPLLRPWCDPAVWAEHLARPSENKQAALLVETVARARISPGIFCLGAMRG